MKSKFKIKECSYQSEYTRDITDQYCIESKGELIGHMLPLSDAKVVCKWLNEVSKVVQHDYDE